MEVDSEELNTKKCYKCEQPVLGDLKIVYNSLNSKTVLWNKYQIFVYKDLMFESPEKIFVPEFQIQSVIVSNNFLVCLDTNGNVHLTSLKFKNTAQKKIIFPFQPRDQCIKTWIRYKKDHVITLKYDADTYFLSFHKINSELQREKNVILTSSNEHWPLQQSLNKTYMLTSHTLTEENFKQLNKMFITNESRRNDCSLVILSFDKLTLYGCLLSPKMQEDEVSLIKLYSCPAEICSIDVMDSRELHLLIGLTMGTMLRLSLNDISNTPDIVHLNTALYKVLALKESLIYSDGVTLWKSDDTFTDDIKMTQFFVGNTYDIAKCGDHIVCTTFTKLIYKFSLDDKNIYQFPNTSDEYCPAEKLLNNSEYLTKLFEEIDKNNELIKKLTLEQDYITALSLSNRQDVVEKAIKTNILVFESYNEASDIDFQLTEDISNYFKGDTWLFLVNISISNIYSTLNDILTHLSDSITIYLTMTSPCKVLKTTSLKMEEPLKTVNFMVPLLMKNVETEININIKIIVNIPNAIDNKLTWSVLYRKDILLMPEHFIKTGKDMGNRSLKKSEEIIEDLIQQTAFTHHGNLFDFNNILPLNKNEAEWTFYIKLPNDYKTILASSNYCEKYFNSTRTSRLLQQWNAKEFLDSKNHIIFEIGNENVKINIHNDGFSHPLLKVTGCNAKISFNIRNFFSNMIYNDYESYESGMEFISNTFYTTTENLQKSIRNCITSSGTPEEFLPLIDQFEKNIIGALPL